MYSHRDFPSCYVPVFMLSFRSHGYGRGQGRRREGPDKATRTNSKSGFRPPVKREGQLGDTVTSGCWFSGRLLRTDSRHRRQADGATGEGRRPRAAAQCHRPACKLKDLVTQYRVTLAPVNDLSGPYSLSRSRSGYTGGLVGVQKVIYMQGYLYISY